VYTANEGPVRIHYKLLVSIYVFPEMKLCGLIISKTKLQCSVFQFSHSCICEQFCIFPRSVCLFRWSQRGRLILGIYTGNHSKIHECRNWEQGCVVSFLRIPKSDFWSSVLKSHRNIFTFLPWSSQIASYQYKKIILMLEHWTNRSWAIEPVANCSSSEAHLRSSITG